MTRWWFPTVVLLATLVLFLLCLRCHAPGIEADVTARARQGLAAEGFDPALVTLDGRDATLAGAVPSPEERGRLVEIVSSVRGVRRVVDSLAPEIPGAPEPGPEPEAAQEAEAPATPGPAPELEAAPEAEAPAAPEPGPEPPTAGDEGLGEAIARLDLGRRVEFNVDSADLRPASRGVLDELAELLAASPDARIRITGHTDSRGAAAHNLDLSRRRAEAVRDYLVSCGLGADRFEVDGAGASQPIDDNATVLGRQRNRRVEARPIEESP